MTKYRNYDQLGDNVLMGPTVQLLNNTPEAHYHPMIQYAAYQHYLTVTTGKSDIGGTTPIALLALLFEYHWRLQGRHELFITEELLDEIMPKSFDVDFVVTADMFQRIFGTSCLAITVEADVTFFGIPLSPGIVTITTHDAFNALLNTAGVDGAICECESDSRDRVMALVESAKDPDAPPTYINSLSTSDLFKQDIETAFKKVDKLHNKPSTLTTQATIVLARLVVALAHAIENHTHKLIPAKPTDKLPRMLHTDQREDKQFIVRRCQ